jgi:hypothetical protein
MAFNFVETFMVQLPDFADMDLDFSESQNANKGLIIEVAAIHERIDWQL